MKPALAISNRMVYSVGFVAAGTWIALAFLRWNNISDGVHYWPPASNAYGLSLLFQSPFQASAVVCAIFLNLAAAVIGYGLVVRPIWAFRQLASPIWLLFAGAIPGYMLVGGFSRIVTLIFPNQVAPWLVLAATVGAVAAIVRLLLRDKEQLANFFGSKAALLGAIALVAVLIFEVRFDLFHVAGEAIVFFIDRVFLSAEHGIGTGGHFPLFSQHYDEAAFLYPSIYGFMSAGGDARATFTVLYWITLGVGRLGAMSLTYISLRSLGCDRLSALVAVAFVVASSLSLNPLSSHILFDSLSPLGYTLHVSRFLIPVLPLVIVAASAELWAARLRWSVSLPVAALLGVGLAAMSLHAALVLLWAIAVLALAALFPKSAQDLGSWRTGCAAAVVVLAGFTAGYSSIASASTTARVVVLLGSSVVAALTVLAPAFATFGVGALRVPDLSVGPAMQIASLCGGYALGVLLLGNVLVHNVRGILGAMWPWPNVAILDRFSAELVSPPQGLLRPPYCLAGLEWSGRVLTGHCASLGVFARTYGLPLVLMTLVLAWLVLRASRKQQLPQDQTSTLIFWGTSLCLVALPVAFVLFDFVGATNPPADYAMAFLGTWLRSRLVEPWFYGGILLSLALFFRQAAANERRWAQSAMMICVAIFVLSPSMLLSQLLANLTYLLEAAVAR